MRVWCERGQATRWLAVGTLVLLLGGHHPAPAQFDAPRAQRLGITFITSLEQPDDAARYRQALALGAGWNRWPLYWDQVERAPGAFTWAAYDRLVSADAAWGLQTNAILLGRPAFHADGGGIAGLGAPIFADGTDDPAPGKRPNPANPWAVFVTEAVTRYKPGGTLSLPGGAGVRVWEAWNEPDLLMFWSAGQDAYARLLKVTYLAVQAADPDARVLFGGLAYGNPDADDWLDAVLRRHASDPQARAHNQFFDAVAVHSYTYARRSGLVVARVRRTLAQYGLPDVPVWLNETGVPVWDDYPGPTWAATDPPSRVLRATQAQAAAFIAQSAAYAWAAGAEVVFYHQLYDDCGNQGRTDFAPNSGQAGDAHGLFRNMAGAPCFSQHPQPGTARPAAAAFQSLARLFADGRFEGGTVSRSGSAVAIAFARPATQERLVVLFNTGLADVTATIEAAAFSGTLYGYGDQAWPIQASDGAYHVVLPPATRDDFPTLPPGEVAAIGGPSFILVERALPPLDTLRPPFPIVTPQGPLPGELGQPLPGGARPARPPQQDQAPPMPFMAPLDALSASTFTVAWGATDDGVVVRYLVWVQQDDGAWTPWLDSARTSASFTGQPGVTYRFAVWAQDEAGNWSANIDLTPMAETTVPGGAFATPTG